MKLYYAPASPFVRKVLITAQELGLDGRIERLKTAAHPVTRDETVAEHNPTGKIPTLLTEDGLALYDSRVICEYLDVLNGNGTIFPKQGAARWVALRDQALADGLLEAALLYRYETLIRPDGSQWEPWATGQMRKILSSVDAIEHVIGEVGDRFDIGAISLGCALGYLDFRFSALLDWRSSSPTAAAWYEEISKRPSVRDTWPHDWPAN